jgi:hypothetical protein
MDLIVTRSTVCEAGAVCVFPRSDVTCCANSSPKRCGTALGSFRRGPSPALLSGTHRPFAAIHLRFRLRTRGATVDAGGGSYPRGYPVSWPAPLGALCVLGASRSGVGPGGVPPSSSAPPSSSFHYSQAIRRQEAAPTPVATRCPGLPLSAAVHESALGLCGEGFPPAPMPPSSPAQFRIPRSALPTPPPPS